MPSSPTVHSVPWATRSTIVRAVSAALGAALLLATPLVPAAAVAAAAGAATADAGGARRFAAAWLALRCSLYVAAAWGACCLGCVTQRGAELPQHREADMLLNVT